MSNDFIEVLYNRDLEELETALTDLPRPGNFYASGTREIPMPKVEIDGVGIISFPMSEDQIEKIIQQATRAPYGKGKETIVDTTVRKTWQLPPEQVHISGKSWPSSFEAILADVKRQLGCQDISVEAELYKLLIYDRGSFFLPHRDSEKTAGMFGTLVFVLPSTHTGGELIISHAGKEVTLDLSKTECSELAFGAFYADCEHEVRPITDGYRVSLIYNLIQKRKDNASPDLSAPDYTKAISEVSSILNRTFSVDHCPTKIAWMLEHQYSQAELSFSTLKNADAAIGQVLCEATLKSNCALHLGIVHIEESGSAEPDYDHYTKRSRWRSYEDGLNNSEGFEVIEVCESEQYVDGWITPQNQRVNFGKLPLDDGELIPEGSLDEEEPDEQRLLEATGNAGVTFERAYHRAAFVIWKTDQYINVLLQSGLAAALVYFKERVANVSKEDVTTDWRKEMSSLAHHIIDRWELEKPRYHYWSNSEKPGRNEMIHLLCKLGEQVLLERFIENVVLDHYDGTENSALIESTQVLDSTKINTLFVHLIAKNMRKNPQHCVGLLSNLMMSTHDMVAAAVEGLTIVEKCRTTENSKENIVELITALWHLLTKMNIPSLRENMVTNLITSKEVFDPRNILPEAISIISATDKTVTDGQFLCLLEHSANALLAKSEYPPESPKDWKQEANCRCKCAHCNELMKFVRDSKTKIYRFRLPQNDRSHLEHSIYESRLDMENTTETQGRPYTLVCTKTRATYEKQCVVHQCDIRAMQMLVNSLNSTTIKENRSLDELQQRLIEAIERG